MWKDWTGWTTRVARYLNETIGDPSRTDICNPLNHLDCQTAAKASIDAIGVSAAVANRVPCPVDEVELRLALGWRLVAIEPLIIEPPKVFLQPPFNKGVSCETENPS